MANLNIKQILGRLKTWIEGHFISTDQLVLPENEEVDLSGGVVFEKGLGDGSIQKKLAGYPIGAQGVGAVSFGGLATGRYSFNEQGGVPVSETPMTVISFSGDEKEYELILDVSPAFMQAGACIAIEDTPTDEDFRKIISLNSEYTSGNWKFRMVVDKTFGEIEEGTVTAVVFRWFNRGSNSVGIASGERSHAEGLGAIADSPGSHAEGYRTGAYAYYSHAEGCMSNAYGYSSHSEGYCTESGVAGDSQYDLGSHAEGKYNRLNLLDTQGEFSQHTVGIGTSNDDRKNAFEISNFGNVWVYVVSGYDGTNPNENNSLQHAIENANVDISYLTDLDYQSIFGAASANAIRNYYLWVDDFGAATGLDYFAAEAGYSDPQDYIADLADAEAESSDYYCYLEDFEFEGSTYKLMQDSGDSGYYALLKPGETLNSGGTLYNKSLQYSLDNHFCPFYAILTPDLDTQYTIDSDPDIMEDKYVLVSVDDYDGIRVSNFANESKLEEILDDWGCSSLDELVEDIKDDPWTYGTNRFKYVDDIEFDGVTYEAWECENYSNGQVQSIGLIGLMETGKTYNDLVSTTIDADETNRLCPFTYILLSDSDDEAYHSDPATMNLNYPLVFIEQRED